MAGTKPPAGKTVRAQARPKAKPAKAGAKPPAAPSGAGKGATSASPGPSVPPAGAATPGAAGPSGAGPWFTCGLGGQMLAENAGLFWVLTFLTYATGLWLVGYLLAVLYLWLVLGSIAQACADALSACTAGAAADYHGHHSGCSACCAPHAEPSNTQTRCTCCSCGGSGSGATDSDGSCCSCGSSSSSSSGGSGDGVGIPGPGAVATGTGLASAWALRRFAVWRWPRTSWAHHPDLPAFRADVWTVRGARVCVGCSTLWPVFLAASALLALVPVGGAWWAWLASGLALASMQLVSAAGWTRWRWLKVLVKSCLGLGLALYLHGVLQAPWPHLAQGAALTAAVSLALVTTWPRRRRIARAVAADA